MPSRGQYWKEGGLVDDTVVSEDIKNADITDFPTEFWTYDEFFYPTPATGLDIHYEKAGTFSAPNDNVGGVVQFSTTTSANNVARINTCGAGLMAIDAGKNLRIVWRAKKVQSDANIAVLLGAFDNQGSFPGGVFPFGTVNNPHAFFRSDGVGNWFAETHDGSTPNSTDTGVASDTNFHIFEIRSNGLSFEFLIDDVIVATFTANLPSGNMAVFGGVQTGTTAVRSIHVDTLYLFNTR
jgi:hypothetical protein